jgi:PAS domain-containing protein
MPASTSHSRAAAAPDSVRRQQGARAASWPPFVIGVAAAAAVTIPAAVLNFSDAAFLFVYRLAIAGAGYGAGRTAGLVAAALSVVSGWYFILPPVRSFALPGTAAPELALFGVAALAAAVWAARMREAVDAEQRIETRLRAEADLLNLSYDALFTWELGGTITFWNRGAEELYGYTREEAVGRVSHDLLRTQHPAGVVHVLDALHAPAGGTENSTIWRKTAARSSSTASCVPAGERLLRQPGHSSAFPHRRALAGEPSRPGAGRPRRFAAQAPAERRRVRRHLPNLRIG